MDSELRREIILDNYLNPENKSSVDDSRYIVVNSNNESCIDNLNIWLLIEDGTIKDVKFDGEACAISTASASIMTKEMIGKSLEEAQKYIDNFEAMVDEREYNRELLNEGIVFDEIYKQANRRTCATLPYKGISRAISKYENAQKND